ncbi:DUF1007 family protein [Rhizobium tumorigenes]|uniref:DUF1007 family protein n=1 Tax=Rhizobium tumorigenes TaxID=2041385 RepID=UPI00241CBE32|nr:DUF1007 family protein [Rhizobium tumorigenes]WFS00741.1 DUF1007 family protein [Rhizobium tumorigenes]
MVRLTILMAAFAASLPAQAFAHPHIFIDATFEAVASADGTLSELRNVWKFDDVFSSSVLLDFDKNENNTLDKSELLAVGKTVRNSLEQYKYYTNVTVNGKAVPMAKPESIQADYKDGALILTFSLKPVTKTTLVGTAIFGIYDQTLYTAVDFASDNDMATSGAGFSHCSRKVVRPNPDEIIAQNQATLTSLFFNDPMGTNFSQLVATRLEMKC